VGTSHGILALWQHVLAIGRIGKSRSESTTRLSKPNEKNLGI
jgi:hypothetical protein